MKKYISPVLLLLVLALPAFAQDVLPNPLGNVTDPNEVIGNVIKAFLGVVGGIALVVFIYSGVMMLISEGKPEQINKAKTAILWAILGLIVIFASYGITRAVFKAIEGQSVITA